MDRVINVQQLRDYAQAAGDAFLQRVQSTDFAIQIAVIAGAALLSAWIAPRIIGLLRRLPGAAHEHGWFAGLIAVVASVSVSGLWLIFLLAASVIASGAEVDAGLIDDGVSLLLAWVVIRLGSHVIRHPFWSNVVFYGAWSIAALDILGQLGRIETGLDGLGFQYGAVRISALNVVRALILFAFLLWLTALLRSFLERRIVHTENLTPSLQALLIQLLKLLFPTFAILVALPVLGINLTALTVFGGAIAVGVGLGLQRTIANLISGFALLMGGAIRPGDVIAVKDTGGRETYGRVTSIGAHYVSLRTRSGIEHLIPNENFLSNGVENWTHSDDKIRLNVPFGISYDSDPRRAIALALEAAEAVRRVVREPRPVCLLTGFGDSSINFELRIWIEDPMNGTANVRSECFLGIWDRFKANGITIPFPQRDVHVLSLPDGAAAIRP